MTVIIPIYNVDRYLDTCLKSIRAQTHANLQIICVNDGSTDSSLNIAKKHASEDSRIEIINKPNEGYGASCNRGLRNARGEWISIIEPDDWIEPTMYADMLAFEATLNEHPDMIKTPYWRIIDANNPQKTRVRCHYAGRVKPSRQPFSIDQAPRLLGYHPSIWSALYRLSFLHGNAIQFHEIPGAGWADNPFMADTLLRAKIAYLDAPYYCYREDSPEQRKATAQNNPLLAIDRWNDIADIIDELKEDNKGVLEQVYRRGLNNIVSMLDAIEPSKNLLERVKSTFDRMEPSIVFDSKVISPHEKAKYAEIRGIPSPQPDKLSWGITRVEDLAHLIAQAGPCLAAKLIWNKRKS